MRSWSGCCFRSSSQVEEAEELDWMLDLLLFQSPLPGPFQIFLHQSQHPATVGRSSSSIVVLRAKFKLNFKKKFIKKDKIKLRLLRPQQLIRRSSPATSRSFFSLSQGLPVCCCWPSSSEWIDNGGDSLLCCWTTTDGWRRWVALRRPLGLCD